MELEKGKNAVKTTGRQYVLPVDVPEQQIPKASVGSSTQHGACRQLKEFDLG
jgi:hypothetical protein